MFTELTIRNQSQQLYNRAVSRAWRNATQLFDPSIWLLRDPEAEEKMLRDYDIGFAVGYRRSLIAGQQWALTPRDDKSALGEMAVEVGTELIEGIEQFTESRVALARAFFSGSRFARIHGKPRRLKLGDGRERTWWIPTRLEDLDKRMFRIVPELATRSAHWERWDVWDQIWIDETRVEAMQTIRHVYQDDQATLGHGRALREALGWLWYTKTHVMQETVQAVEKHAQGTITVKIDGLRDANADSDNKQVMDEYVATIEDMRARHVIAYDSRDEIQIMQGGGEGWQLLDVMEKKLKASAITLVLGSNLPTQATEGGSYALAGIQENSTDTMVQFDRQSLEETLTKKLVGCVWFKNHANLVELGLADEKPRFTITQDKHEDPKDVAATAAVLHAMGADLSMDDVYTRTGFRKPEEGEDIIAGSTTPVAVPGMGGLGGFGAPDLGV